MLFWIFVIGLVIGLGLYFYCSKYYVSDFIKEFLTPLILVSSVIFSVAIGVVLVGIHIHAPIEEEILTIRYDMLVYQYETDMYDNDNDYGKRELVEDIQKWNENINAKKRMHDDIWLGIFIPDIYDQFELIDLEELDKKKVG